MLKSLTAFSCLLSSMLLQGVPVQAAPTPGETRLETRFQAKLHHRRREAGSKRGRERYMGSVRGTLEIDLTQEIPHGKYTRNPGVLVLDGTGERIPVLAMRYAHDRSSAAECLISIFTYQDS